MESTLLKCVGRGRVTRLVVMQNAKSPRHGAGNGDEGLLEKERRRTKEAEIEVSEMQRELEQEKVEGVRVQNLLEDKEKTIVRHQSEKAAAQVHLQKPLSANESLQDQIQKQMKGVMQIDQEAAARDG